MILTLGSSQRRLPGSLVGVASDRYSQSRRFGSPPRSMIFSTLPIPNISIIDNCSCIPPYSCERQRIAHVTTKIPATTPSTSPTSKNVRVFVFVHLLLAFSHAVSASRRTNRGASVIVTAASSSSSRQLWQVSEAPTPRRVQAPSQMTGEERGKRGWPSSS